MAAPPGDFSAYRLPFPCRRKGQVACRIRIGCDHGDPGGDRPGGRPHRCTPVDVEPERRIGGIGWGAPEALAEIMAIHGGLAEEFGHMLVAYMRPDGCYLEPRPCRGASCGAWEDWQEPDPTFFFMIRNAPVYLPPYLDAEDAVVRGLAARALGLLKVDEAKERLDALRADLTTYSPFSMMAF